jgi:hypothetical protein
MVRIGSVFRNRLDQDPAKYLDPDSVNMDPKHCECAAEAAFLATQQRIAIT